MIGCRAADLIKASGRRPHPKAEWMAAAKANCQKLEKALAEREASMDGWTVIPRNRSNASSST